MHRPMPAYRAARQLWYVEIDKKQIPLGKHPDGLPEPKKSKTKGGARGEWSPPEEILRAYYRVMAEYGHADVVPAAVLSRAPAVAEVLDEFLGWLKDQPDKAERTVRWYAKYLQSFLESLPDQGILSDALSPRHVREWLKLHPDWKGSQRGAIAAVQRAFNWSAKQGMLKVRGLRSPLAGIEKPQQGRREQIISRSEFATILEHASDQNFKDLLTAAWETGARPHELFTVEASYFDEAGARWVFPVRLSKGKRVQRVVHLPEGTLAITQRLAATHPEGPIFRNGDGEPWRQSSVKCRFQRLRDALGKAKLEELGLTPPKIKRLTKVERADPERVRRHKKERKKRARLTHHLALQHGTMFPLYAFRHSYCTEMLVLGEDAVTVSVLMGHKDTTMISRHYAHLTQHQEHLQRAVNRRGGGDVSE
jgi:integrase